MPAVDDETRLEIIKRYANGETAPALSYEYGVSVQTVRRYASLARKGIWKAKPTGQRAGVKRGPTKLTQEVQAKIKRLATENPSMPTKIIQSMLAEDGHDLSLPHIGDWMRKNGLTKKERMKLWQGMR